MHSLLLAASDLADTPSTFPGLFTLYTFLFALTVLYYLLLSPNFRAFAIGGPLQKLLKWALGEDQQLKISGIGFALLSGKIYLNHVEYRTKNSCIRVLQSTVRINWWFSEVRDQDTKHDEKLPCRLSLELVGLEYIIYHNSYVYDHLAELIFGAAGMDLKSEMENAAGGKKGKGGGGAKKNAPTSPQMDGSSSSLLHGDGDGGRDGGGPDGAPVEPKVIVPVTLPGFYRFFPVTKVTIKSLNVMIGNLKLPTFLVVHCSSAQILHATSKPASPHAAYACITEVTHLLDAEIYLQRNPDYRSSADLKHIKQQLDEEDYFLIAIETFGRILKEKGPLHSEAKNPPKGPRDTHRIMESQTGPTQLPQNGTQMQQTQPPSSQQQPNSAGSPFGLSSRVSNGNTASQSHGGGGGGGGGNGRNGSIVGGGGSGGAGSDEEIEMVDLARGRGGSVIDKDPRGSSSREVDQGIGLGFDSDAQPRDVAEYILVDDMTQLGGGGSGGNAGTAGGSSRRDAAGRARARGASNPAKRGGIGGSGGLSGAGGLNGATIDELDDDDANFDDSASSAASPRPASAAASAARAIKSDKEMILECREMNLEYSFDVPQLLTARDVAWFKSHLLAVPNHAAKQRIRLEFCRTALIRYGPWTDHQRALLMSYFKPWDYRNQEVFVPEIGVAWPYTSLVIDAVWLNDDSNIKLPYRDLYKLAPSLGLPGDVPLPESVNTAAQATQNVEITFGAESWLSYDMGWSAIDAKLGTCTNIKANLAHATIWTHVPSASSLPGSDAHLCPIFQPLVECELLDISVVMHWPTLWNALYKWRYSLNFHTAKLWYTSNVMDWFGEFLADWSKYGELSSGIRKIGGTNLSYFVPTVWTYAIALNDYEVYLNVNENNVIDVEPYPTVAVGEENRRRNNANATEGGAAASGGGGGGAGGPGSSAPLASQASSRRSKLASRSPPPPCSSAVRPPSGYGTINNLDTNTYVILRGPDLLVKLTTPWVDFHARCSNMDYEVHIRNIRAHLSLPRTHPLLELIESSNNFQMLYINHLKLVANQVWHYKFNTEYRDSHRIHMAIEGAELDAFGHYMRYLIAFKENYFGNNTSWISSKEYAKYGWRNIQDWTRYVKYYEGPGPGGGGAGNAGNASAASPPPGPEPASQSTGVDGQSLPRSVPLVSEDRNASELSFSITAENLSVNLPLHLYSNPSPSLQPKLRCYTLQVEMRSVQQYFDLLVSAAPLTATIPIPLNSPLMQLIRVAEDDTDASVGRNRSWNEKETYLHVKDIMFSLHMSKGDLPRLTVYRSLMKLHISSVLGQLFPQQLMTFATCAGNFMEQWAEAADHTIHPPATDLTLPTTAHAESKSASKWNSSTGTMSREEPSSPRETPEQLQIKSELTAYLQDLQLYTRLADLGLEVAVRHVQFNLLHPPLPPNALTVSMASQAVHNINAERAKQWQQAHGNKGPLPSGPNNPVPQFPAVATSHLSLTRLILPQGLQVYSSSLITPQSHSKLVAEVPAIDLSYLICADLKGMRSGGAEGIAGMPGPMFAAESMHQHRASRRAHSASAELGDDFSRWVSIFQLRLGVTVTKGLQRSDWLSAMRRQQDFIYSQMHQEGPMDDSEAYPWHEANANKVPYVLVDDAAMASAGMDYHAQMQMMQTHNQQSNQQFQYQQQQQQYAQMAAQAHHHHPRLYRSRNPTGASGSSGQSTSRPSQLSSNSSVTIEDGEFEEKDEEYRVRTTARTGAQSLLGIPSSAADPLNSVAEEDESSRQGSRPGSRSASAYSRNPSARGSAPSLSHTSSEEAFANSDALPPLPGMSPGPLLNSGAHYLSHVRQRSFQIGRGGRRATVGSVTSSPAMHQRSHSFLQAAGGASMAHLRTLSNNLMSSRSEGQPNPMSQPNSPMQPIRPLGVDSEDDEHHQRIGRTVPAATAAAPTTTVMPDRRESSTTSRRSQWSTLGDEDNDDFESCKSLPSGEHSSDNSDTEERFEDCEQLEGVPNLAPPPMVLSTAAGQHRSTRSASLPPHTATGPTSPKNGLSSLFESASAAVSSAASAAANAAGALGSPRGGHSRVRSIPPGINAASLLNDGSGRSPLSPTRGAVGSPRGAFQRAVSPSPRTSQHASDGSGLGTPQPPRLPNYVSPLPPLELQMYLEHYALNPASHAFVQGQAPGASRGAVNRSNPAHLNMLLNRATVFDSSLAGTSAGAFLSLPVVQFDQLNCSSDSCYSSTGGGFADDTFTGSFEGTYATTSYSGGGESAYYPAQPPQHMPSTAGASPAAFSSSSAATSPQPQTTSSHWNAGRRGSTDATGVASSAAYAAAAMSAEGVLAAPTPLHPSSSRMHSNKEPFLVTPVIPAGASSGSQHGPHSSAGGPSHSSVGVTQMEIVHNKHTLFNTSKVVVEMTSDVTMLLCPSFIANLDQYLPFLQPGYTTLEDTLDELHMQFTRAFAKTVAPIVVAPPNNVQAPCNASDAEVWHTSCAQVSFLMPRLYVELLQSSTGNTAETDWVPPSPRSRVSQQTAHSRNVSGRFGLPTAVPSRPPKPKPVIYATTLCVEGVSANIAQNFPLPQLFTNTVTGASLLNAAPKPSSQGQLSLNKLHAYSCILNPQRYCGMQQENDEDGSGSTDEYDSHVSSTTGHVHSSACWGPNSIAIPQQELESLLPPAILSTSAVFVSAELHNTVLSFQQSTTTDLNPLYAKPSVALTMPSFSNGVVSPVAADELTSPASAPVGTHHRAHTKSAVTFNEKPDHARAGSASSVLPNTPPATYRILRRTPPGAPSSGTGPAASSAESARSFSFVVEDGDREAASTPGELTPTQVVLPRQLSSHYLHPSSAVHGGVPPSPAALNAFVHSHASSVRVHLANMAVLSGWDAPSRVVTATKDWITALNQLEIFAVAREWQGEAAVAASQAAAAEQQAAKESAAGVAGSPTGNPAHKDPAATAAANANASALALFSTLPGGPGTSLRRSRWQTLIAFALQHVVHSRALDESRGGSKSFGETDQLRLLQWMHHRCRMQMGLRPDAVAEGGFLGSELAPLDEVGHMLQTYGVSTTGVYYPPGSRHDLMDYGVSVADLNFLQSGAAPLTLTLRKLLKLPPSLMRRLNYKLQRSDEASFAHVATGASSSSGVGGSGVPLGFAFQPLFGNGASTSSAAELDFVKLYANEKLEASELARLALQVFALVAPQAAKVKALARSSDLCPGLWQSVLLKDFHRSEVDSSDINVEWQLSRVRVRVAHAPVETSAVGAAVAAVTSVVNAIGASPPPSCNNRRDHAISINGLRGSFTLHDVHSFHRAVSHPPTGSRGSTSVQTPHPSGSFSASAHAPFRPAQLVRSNATRALVDPVVTPSSRPQQMQHQLSVTVSPPTPGASPNQTLHSNQTPGSAGLGWLRDRDVLPLRGNSTIQEGRESSHSSHSPTPSPQPQHSPRSPMRSAIPLGFGMNTVHPHSSYATSHLHALSSATHWLRSCDSYALAHASDVLIDIGPDIHRFLASLVAATFVFADIHQRNVASSHTAAARHVAKMKALGADLDADPVALFEQEQAAALAKSQAAKRAAHPHRDSSGLLVASHLAPAHLCEYVFEPFVTSNYFLSLDIDTVGARARVPGTAALHVVTQSLCVSLNSFRPLNEAELESKQKSKPGAAAGLTGSRKNKGVARTPAALNRRTPPQTTALPVRSLTGGSAPRGSALVATSETPLVGSRPMPRADEEESKCSGAASLHPSADPLTLSTSYTAGHSAPSLFDQSRVDAATVKVATLDIRLMDQDVDDASLDELTAAAVSATAAAAVASNAQSGGITPANGAPNGSFASTRPPGTSVASKGGKKGTVLFSMFLRTFALNIDQALLNDAVALNKQFLATSFATNALASAARASPRAASAADTRPPLAHQGSIEALPLNKTGEALNPSHSQPLVPPVHQRMHSASMPKEVARALSATAASVAAARASISEANGPMSPASSVVVSSASRQVGSHVQRLMVVVRSEQSVVTLPFHQLERMYVSDYIDPWKPVVAVFNASSAIDQAREEEEARLAAKAAAAEQSQAEGYTSAAFAWMRGETGASSGASAHQHKKTSEAASSKLPSELGPLDAPLASMSTYLSTPSSPLASYTHWSILTQLRGVSLVMLPLPSVMFTYHLDRMFVKLSSPRPQELHLLLSVGQEAEPSDNAPGTAPVLNAGGFALVGDTSPSQHKLTLHSANVKQKKKPGSHAGGEHDDSGNGSGGITPSENKPAMGYPNSRAHPLEKPLPSARGAKPKYDTLRRSPHNAPPPVAVSSAVGPAGAAAYGTVSKMQFVLEFRLPTIRASLQIRQHDLRAIQLLRADTVRAAAVAAASAAVDSPTQARHIREFSRPLPSLPDSSSESSGDSGEGSSSDGSSDDSSSDSSSDSESDTDALLAGRPVRRRGAAGPGDRKRRHHPRLLNEIDGLIAVGAMTNHLDENVLQRLLHLQATLNTEVNQLLDKFSQYSKEAGLEEASAAATAAAAGPAAGMRRQTSRGSSVSVPAPAGANTRRALSLHSPLHASSSPARRAGVHGKHLSTLDDLSLTQSSSGPPGHSHSASATDELLSPMSAAFKQGGGASGGSKNAPYAHLIAQPLSMASRAPNPLLQRTKSNSGKSASPNMISAAAVVAAPASSSSTASTLWSRYCFNVNFVFENIHITAGLSAKKTAMPVSRITGGQWAQAQQNAVAALHGFNAPSLGPFSGASPRAGAGQGSQQQRTSGGANSGTVASSAALALSPSGGIASLPVAERAAHFQPVIHISTGTFSLSMRYKPKAAIKPMRLLAAYEKQRAELRGEVLADDQKAPAGADSKTSSDRNNLRINLAAAAAAEKSGGTASSSSVPTDGIGRRQSIPPSSAASPAIASAPASLVSQSGYRLEEGSNVIIEMAFQGVGLKVTTLNSQIVTPFGLPPSTIDLMSAPGASPTPVLLMPHPTRRTLVECRSDVRLRVGFKVSGTYTCADVLLERTLMKVSAIPITSASIYVLSSNYMKAFADFEVERARLVQEKEIRDPLIGLRALKANKVWSHLQSEFPAINATINAAAGSGNASPTTQQIAEGADSVRSNEGRRLPAHLDTSDPDLSGVTNDALSPTSAAAALAIAAGHENNSSVDVGSGSMLPPPALANLPAPASTKYEMHFCMQSTEMVMLFEKDVAGSAQQENAFEQNKSDAAAAGSYAFNPLLYQLGYADPLSGLSGALSAMLPSAAPTANSAALSALVIFLDEMDVSVDYAPPTPAAYRAAMAAMLPASLYAAAAAGGSGSHHLSSYQSLFRPPVNSVTSDIRFTGMELGCLSDVCVDTNELDVLASSLRKYRVQPTAVKLPPGGEPPSPKLDEEAMSPRDAAYTSKHPYRSFSLLPGARLDGSGGGASAANTRSGLVRHVYNRFVCASTVFHVRGALPLAIPPTATTAPEEPAAGMPARGGMASGTHSRHRSAQWNQAPQPSPPGGSSASAFSTGVAPSLLLPVSREHTWEIDTQCSGAELDIDPSLVNHLSNLTSLVDLMSNYGSSSSNNIEVSQSPSPRASISDPIGLGVAVNVERDGGSTLSSPTRLSRKRSSSARAHSRTLGREDRDGPAAPRSHSSLHGTSAFGAQRTRKGLLRRASMRRRSLPDSGHASDTSAEEAFSDAEPRRSQAYYRAHSNESSASAAAAAAAASVSPAHATDSAGQGGAPKDDLSVELKINIQHGRCCLHALPQVAMDDKGIPIVPPASASTPASASASAAPPSLLSEDVYADFILPSICCTLILSTIPKEEVLLLVDLSLPPITLNPSILVFMEEVQAEMARIAALAAAAATPATAAAATPQQPASNDEANRTRKLPVVPFRPTTAGISSPAGPSGRGTPVDMGTDQNDDSTEQVAVLSEPSFLATFLNGCAAANRNITVNVRLKHTLVKLNCLPMYDGVFLQFGSKRSIDVCICVAQLDQQKLGLPVAVPYISCTTNVPSVFLQLGMLPVSQNTSSPSSSSSSVGGVTFLDVRCRHAKLEIMEAYNIRSDGAPCRTLLFHMDGVAPAMVAVNAMAVFASFYKVWLLQPTPTNADKEQPTADNTTSTALVPASSSSSSAASAAAAPSAVSKYTASRASFYYFAIGKVEGEANMLDVVDMANRWNFSLSRLSTRVLDVGGCFPAGCYPLMITMRSGELVFMAEPELDGMEGTFACPKGLQLAFCRLPLQTVHNTSFDFFEPLYDSETDNESDVSDVGQSDYFSEASVDLGSEVSNEESRRRRRQRVSETGSPSGSPAPASIKPMQLEGRRGKRMVNMLELSISATNMNFNIAHGRVQLLKSESSPVVLSLLDHWEDRLDGVGFLEGDGDWSLKLYVDLGERLRIEASSRAMPYLLEMITSLIKFTQGEFSRVRIPSMHVLRIANAVARQRRAAAAAATASLSHAASQKPEPSSSAAGSPALSTKEQQRLDKKASRYNTLGTSDPYHLNAPAPSPRRPSITVVSGPPVPAVAAPTPMPAGKLALHGGILELRLSSPEDLERDIVLVEFVDFNVSLARQLHYSDQQIKEQQLLLELRRKRVHLAAQQAAAMMQANGNFGSNRDSVMHLDSLPSMNPSLTSPGFGGLSSFSGASQSNAPGGTNAASGSKTSAIAGANPADVSHIRTEEELSVALALVDEETDPLKRLAARSSQTLPYRGGALQPFLPLDLHRTLLLDIGKHRKVATQGQDGQAVYVWQPDLSQPSIAARVSRVGATGPGIYVSRLTQLSGRLLSSSYDDADAEIDHIFRVPGFVLEMETLDPLESDLLKSRFVAFWDKSITVSIDVRAYKFLQQMQEAFASKVKRAMEQVESQALQAIEVQRIEREGRATLEEEEEAMRREEAAAQAAGGAAPGAVVPFLSAADKMRTVRFKLDVPSTVAHLDGTPGSGSVAAHRRGVAASPKAHQRSPSVRVRHGADAAASSQLYRGTSASSSAASVPVAPKLEKGFDPESYFELNNPQLHVLDSATGISVRKILDLWESLGSSGSAASGVAQKGEHTKKGGAKASKEEQIIPAATHQITQMLDSMLVACVGASKTIDAAFEG